MFTRKTTFGELMQCTELAKSTKYFMPQPSDEGIQGAPDADQMKNTTFEMMCSFVSPAWNPDSMAEGFDAIVAHMKNGVPMEQQIYSSEEIAADPTKDRAGLLWFPSKEKGPFALVCAGGAYMSVASLVEAFPVAKRLNELGISAFVLQYRAGVKGAAPKSGEDIRRAITYIIDHKDTFNVEEGYAAMGFSAGGHLVSELGTSNQGYKVYDLPKPQMLCLCYPLVAFAKEDDQMRAAVSVMFEGEATKEVLDEFTPVNHLDKDYPKTFIWQTKEDEQVPYEANALEIYNRLVELEVPCKLKAVEHGLHGLGLGEDSEAAGWLDEAVAYWKNK